MNKLGKFLKDRLKEKSTWSGLAVLGLLVGVDPVKVDMVVQVGAAILGAGCVVLPDRKAE
jgi:hypothetical protein